MPIRQTDSTLVAKNLTFLRGRDTILHDTSLSLATGDVLGLIGLNGAGKSTTLACLAGHLAPTSGAVEVAGCDLIANPVQARRHIGYLPDPPALFNEFRVDRHLQAIADLRGLRGQARTHAVARVTEHCSLEDVSGKRIGHLSQGYRQRVGLAQAMLHQPALLLLDEPTNGLDIDQQQKFAQTIRSIASDTAVIISSHHLSDVRACCTRVATLAGGVLSEHTPDLAPGTVETVFIRVAQPISHADLCALPMVADAEPERDGWKVTVHGGTAQLSTGIADRGWGLMQLSPLLFEPTKPAESTDAAAIPPVHAPEVSS